MIQLNATQIAEQGKKFWVDLTFNFMDFSAIYTTFLVFICKLRTEISLSMFKKKGINKKT